MATGISAGARLFPWRQHGRQPLWRAAWLIFCAVCALAESGASAALGQALPPVEVGRDAHAGPLTAWTRLPPIRIDRAEVTVDGEALRWDVVDRSGSFAVMRSTDSTGAVEWSAYAGPQRLSFVTTRRGSRIVQRALRATPLPAAGEVAAGVLPISGIDPGAVAGTLTLEAEADGATRRFDISRKVSGADIVELRVNGVSTRLAAFVVELEMRRPGWGETTRSQSLYVPVLGMGVGGAVLAPDTYVWKVEAVTVGPGVVEEVRAAALR